MSEKQVSKNEAISPWVRGLMYGVLALLLFGCFIALVEHLIDKGPFYWRWFYIWASGQPLFMQVAVGAAMALIGCYLALVIISFVGSLIINLILGR